MVSSVVSPNVEYVLCVPPMVCGLQLLAAIRFSFFVLGRGVRERLVYRSPLPGVGKPAMVVVRVQGPPTRYMFTVARLKISRLSRLGLSAF